MKYCRIGECDRPFQRVAANRDLGPALFAAERNSPVNPRVARTELRFLGPSLQFHRRGGAQLEHDAARDEGLPRMPP